jgi:hypothetical protein
MLFFYLPKYLADIFATWGGGGIGQSIAILTQIRINDSAKCSRLCLGLLNMKGIVSRQKS